MVDGMLSVVVCGSWDVVHGTLCWLRSFPQQFVAVGILSIAICGSWNVVHNNLW